MGNWDDAVRAIIGTCQHGVALDVHCCGCHSGFLFDAAKCTCIRVAPDTARLGVCLKCGDEGLIGCGCDCCGGDVYRAQE